MELVDLRNGLSVADLLSLTGNAIVVAIVVELLKRTLEWSDATVKRWAPLVSCASGVLLAVLASALLSGDVAQAALTGFLAGALAAGLYDVAAERIAGVFAKIPPRGPAAPEPASATPVPPGSEPT